LGRHGGEDILRHAKGEKKRKRAGKEDWGGQIPQPKKPVKESNDRSVISQTEKRERGPITMKLVEK